jgi:hypothetical protein
MNWQSMLEHWKRITAAVTGTVAVIVILFGIYSHFHTDLEAAEHVAEFTDYKVKQFEAFKLDRIDRHQREVDRIEFRLLSDELSEKERAYLVRKIQQLQDQIKCIREEKC